MTTVFLLLEPHIPWVDANRHDDHWQSLYWDLASSMQACMKEVARIVGEHSWILYHNNAPMHWSYIVSQFLSKNQMTVLSHPPSSLNLDVCDFFLYNKLKDFMWETHFCDVEVVKTESACLLNTIPESYWKNTLRGGKNECNSALQYREIFWRGQNCSSRMLNNKWFFGPSQNLFDISCNCKGTKEKIEIY